MGAIPGTGKAYDFDREPSRTWELFVSLEGLGVDAMRAKVSDLSLHTLTVARQLITWADAPSRTLYLWGSPGCGKTYAGLVILRRVFGRCRHAWVRYLDASRVTEYGKASGSGWLRETYGDCDLLMLDDVGVAMPADWEQKWLYDLVDHRCQKRKLPTIVTSNLCKEELKKVVTERVVSRLVGDEIELMVGDIRR